MSKKSKKDDEIGDVNGPEIGDANDPATYRKMIKRWRSALEQTAKGTLAMTGLPPEESENLYRALNLLPNIEHLIDLIDRNIPEQHLQAYTLSKVWGVISAVFIIANRGHKNPVSGKLQTKGAASVQNSRSKHLDLLVEKHVKSLLLDRPWLKSANSIAWLILKPVNDELGKVPKPLTAAEKKADRDRTRQVTTLTDKRDKGKLKAGEFEAEIEKLKKPLEPKEKAAKIDAIRDRVTKILAKNKKRAA